MKIHLLASLAISSLFVPSLHAATLLVTTTDSDSPPAGTLSLKQALQQAQDGDTVAFQIPGDGPHYLPTPDGGYPIVLRSNLTIDGYTQPGSAPNTNPILAGNNAKIQIVLDSRNGNHTVMDGESFPQDFDGDSTGFGDDEAGVLGFHSGTGLKIRGLSIVGQAKVGTGANVSLYGIALAHGASAHISGNYIGVGPEGQPIFLDDGTTLSMLKDGIAGFRYRVREPGLPDVPILINDVVVGVAKDSIAPRAEFNVFSAITTIPVAIEGNRARISGNYLNVNADGKTDFIPSLLENPPEGFEGAIEIGRGGNGTVIGVDGDGVNDTDERNVFGGVLPPPKGYDHTIEFYGQSPGSGIIIAGNYIGLGVNGVRFTNGVPALNATGGSAQYRFGSDFNGVSDGLEANVVANNWPAEYFPAETLPFAPKDQNFFSELQPTGTVSARGNVMINNYPFPSSPLKDGGTFLKKYYTRVIADVEAGVSPTLEVPAAEAINPHLKGTVPATTADYVSVVLDVYIADAEGILTGQTAAIEALPEGFLQGRRYLGSFVVDGAADLDPNPSAFEFDITRLGGGLLTVTANYSKEAADVVSASMITSPFSNPAFHGVTPLTAEESGLARIKADQIIYNDLDVVNLDNWEPYTSVLGNSTFLIEAGTFTAEADNNQRFALAFQPAAGGAHALGEAFFADDGTPYRSKINNSRQNGNPGRVAGDKRPGAVNFIAGGETSAHFFEPFQSNNRWAAGPLHADNARFATVQSHSLDTTSLTQTRLSLAQDSANGRLSTDTVFAADPQQSRFGGELAGLDNGNFVALVEDKTKLRNPAGDATVVTIFAPDGSVVKETFLVANTSIWCNLAAYKGGFCVRAGGVLYFFDNAGELRGQVANSLTGGAFDNGRGDNTRIASHINSDFVFLTGPSSSAPKTVRLAAFDARDFTVVGLTDVNEVGMAGNTITGDHRATVAVDALNRVAVAYESLVAADRKTEVLVRVFQFNAASSTLTPLTASFHAFVNSIGGDRTTTRANISMTTKQILVAAKGVINSENDKTKAVDTKAKTTFFTVFGHPAPAEDPTPAVGGGERPIVSIGNSAGVGPVKISFTGTLESTTSIAAPNWQPVVGATSPYTPTGNGVGVFYRSVK